MEDWEKSFNNFTMMDMEDRILKVRFITINV